MDFSRDQLNKGFNIQDENFLTGLQTGLSINPSQGETQMLATVIIENAPATSCPCPKRRLFIDGDLDSIAGKTKLQRQKPELFKKGREWNGPVVFYLGRFWTASADTGMPTWTKASIPLLTRWDGIELLNKRVVTNERTYSTRHSKFGLKYYGEYVGLHAHIPESYSSLVQFFTSSEGITPWVLKALCNGLDCEYPKKDVSKYKFMWEELYNRYKLSVEDESGGSLSTAADEALLLEMERYAGFIDDANLDGRFDVADLVAMHNSAQMRLLMPNPTNVSDDSSTSATAWKSPPVNWEIAARTVDDTAFKKVLKNAGADAVMGAMKSKQSGGTDFSAVFRANKDRYPFVSVAKPNSLSIGATIVKDNLPNLSSIVPSYCLNTFCTETFPDHCPAIVGGDYAETQTTLIGKIGDCESSGKQALQYFSQRVDILPDKKASAKFNFSAQPATNSSIKLQSIGDISESLKFTSQANGTDLDGGFKSIQIGANLNTTISNVLSWFSSGTATDITAAAIGSSPNQTGFTLTQVGIGAKGNTKIHYRGTHSSLINRQAYFSGGSAYTSNLQPAYRDWAQYFISEHTIKNAELYQNEEVYGENGASYFEVKTSLNCEEPFSDLTPFVGFVAKSDATINFCGGYDASTQVKVKVLPGDGFKMCDVYDAETGALLVASTATEYNNFYNVPNHGKINIISHNYAAAKGYQQTRKSDLKNSKHFTPITQDGGALVTAKIFVTPMPDWEQGKYIELLCGKNHILGGSNLSLSTGMKAPIGNWQEKLTSKSFSAGPKTSQFSQNYKDNSSSLHTYADYMLHTEVVGPKHIRIKYNTMKPFKYASFTVRTHNGTEIEKVALADDPSRKEKLSGWTVDHTFHEEKTDAYGLPQEPSQYQDDGYSVVNVYITGSYTDSGGAVHLGVAYPEAFNGMGDLCDIYFKEPLFEEFPIPGKKYICPPIGQTKRLFFPIMPLDNWADPTLTGVEKSYPEGSREKTKFFYDIGKMPLIANFDAETSFNAQVVEGANSKVNTWISTPGTEAGPANGVSGHKPNFTVATNDTRKSVHFAGGMGISTDASGVGLRKADPHKWSIYTLVDFTDTITGSNLASGKKATIFSTGGEGTASGSTGRGLSQFEHKLQILNDGGTFKLQAISTANNTSATQKTKMVEKVVTSSDHSGWQMVTWTGNSETGEFILYLNGAKDDASQTLSTPNDTHSTALGEHGMVWHIGHDGSNMGSISGIGNSSGGNAFSGRIGQIMMYDEVHDEDEVQKTETYFAVKNPNEGTATLQSKLPDNHIGALSTVVGSVTGVGITVNGYLKNINVTDILILRKKDEQDKKEIDRDDIQVDKGSDRCAAQWVSDHVCVDKSSQTLLSVSCEGTGEGFILG